MIQQMDKVALLDEMQREYTALESILTSLDEEQMTTAGVNRDWSIKDIISHLTAWQRVLVQRLQAVVHNEEPVLSDSSDENIDEVNERFYQESKFRPPAQVLTDFRTTYAQIAEAVQMLTWEDLSDTHRFAWLNGIPLWRYIAGDTYEHYREHMEPIHEFLKAGQYHI